MGADVGVQASWGAGPPDKSLPTPSSCGWCGEVTYLQQTQSLSPGGYPGRRAGESGWASATLEGDLTSRDPLPPAQRGATGTCVLDGTRKTLTESRAETSQVAWWLGLRAAAAKNMGLIPGRGTKDPACHVVWQPSPPRQKKPQDQDDLPMLDSGMAWDGGLVMVPSAHTPTWRPQGTERTAKPLPGSHLECVEKGMDTGARRCRSRALPPEGRSRSEGPGRLPEVLISGTQASLSHWGQAWAV